MWSSGGKGWFHSIEEGMCEENRITRWETNLSQIIKINIRIPIIEIVDPIVEIIFQEV